MLTVENYDIRKIQMEALLIKYDLWDLVSGVVKKPEGEATAAAWTKNGYQSQV